VPRVWPHFTAAGGIKLVAKRSRVRGRLGVIL
jgi:hypothetical protein